MDTVRETEEPWQRREDVRRGLRGSLEYTGLVGSQFIEHRYSVAAGTAGPGTEETRGCWKIWFG